jgi:MFS family permease
MNERNAAYPRPAYAWSVVAILMVAYVFSFIDRQILSLLVGPIERDLGVSDTSMGLLMGFYFALFYTFCGIPLGRLADRRSRRRIIALGVLGWSLMTGACGLARVYWQFALFRMGVGVGEASLSPAAYSLITDSFPRERRATAVSVYAMGIYIGTGLAYLLGGLVIGYVSAKGALELPLLGAVRPWQLVFLLLGAAGAAFTLVLLTVREPARQGVGAGAGLSVGESASYLWANRRTILLHNLGFALVAFVAYGSAAWVPSYFIRVYGWSMRDIGIAYGLVVAVCGSLGIVFGGWLADRLARKGYSDGAMRVGLGAAVLALPFCAAYLLVGSAQQAIVLLAPAVLFLSMPFGVAPAAIQEIVPNTLRGQASALYLFVINLIGLGLGPTAVALCTDQVFHDKQAVGLSMLTVSVPALLLAMLLLSLSLKPYRASLERLRDWSATPGKIPT